VRVLGVDPGTIKMGWAVVDYERGEMRRVAGGVFKLKGEIHDRVVDAYRDLCEELDFWKPNVVVFEAGFVGDNAKTSLAIGYARAAVFIAAGIRGIPFREYSPAEVKKGATGQGNASKGLVTAMMRGHFGLDTLSEDEADALAVATTHLNHQDEAALIAAARE